MKRSIRAVLQIFVVLFALSVGGEGQTSSVSGYKCRPHDRRAAFTVSCQNPTSSIRAGRPSRPATTNSPGLAAYIASYSEKKRGLRDEAFAPSQISLAQDYLRNTNRRNLRVVVYTSLRILLIVQDGKPSAYYPIAVGKDNWMLDGNYAGELKKSTSRFHTIQNGDSLWSISRRFKVDSFTLASFNELATTDILFPGNILRIPKTNVRLTPYGVFTITNKLKDPVYRKDYKTLRPFNENRDNLFGTRWIGLNKSSYGIHGTNEPETIGTYSTDGCIRMLNGDIEKLFDFVEPGFLVEIIKKPNS